MVSIIKNIITEMRPTQWMKNLLIFAPLVFASGLFELNKLLIVVSVFVLFCLMAGSVYIINDVIDKDKDRIHPRKRFRPIANGSLNINTALLFAFLFLAIALIGSYYINWRVLIIFLIYFLLNIFYSLSLKNVVILDAITISIGFILRLYAGAVPINIKINHWILACVFLLSLFLVFTKRRQELGVLQYNSANHRESLSQYTISFLDQVIGISAIATLISYMLWTISDETITKFHTESLFYTTPFVFFGILRYLYHINKGTVSDNPMDLIFKDKLVLFDVVAWLCVIIFIIYH